MADKKNQFDMNEALAEFMAYIPIGALYELKDAIPNYSKRGKSQVQIAKLVAKMASDQAKKKGEDSLENFLRDTASFLKIMSIRIENMAEEHSGGKSKNPDKSGSSEPKADKSSGKKKSKDKKTSRKKTKVPSKTAAISESKSANKSKKSTNKSKGSNPITGYSDLKVADVLKKAKGLSNSEIKALIAYEKANKKRKSLLLELNKLAK